MPNPVTQKIVLPASRVLCLWRRAGKEVTLVWRPRNNGLFFPGSLLHPRSCPLIGLQSPTIHQDRKLWQTETTLWANHREARTKVTHSSHFPVQSQSSAHLAVKSCLTHKNSFNWQLYNDLRWHVSVSELLEHFFRTQPQEFLICFLRLAMQWNGKTINSPKMSQLNFQDLQPHTDQYTHASKTKVRLRERFDFSQMDTMCHTDS